jgi:PAS domain S-box-containing protein
MDNKQQIKIITIGNCFNTSDNIIEKSCGDINFKFITKDPNDIVDKEYILCPPNDTAGIFICCHNPIELHTEGFINYLHNYYSHVPIFALLCEPYLDKESLCNLYRIGIHDHIYMPKDNTDYEIITHKVISALDMFKYRSSIESSITANMSQYTFLLDAINTAYIIFDSCYIVQEANSTFLNMINCQAEEIINIDFSNWIIEDDKPKFYNIIDKIKNKTMNEDFEIRIVKNKSESIWLSVNGSCIEHYGHKILWVARNITQKKIIEHKNFLNKQKKKDFIIQDIKNLRSLLKE